MNTDDLGLENIDISTVAGRAEALAKIAKYEKEIAMTEAVMDKLDKAIQERVQVNAGTT